MTLKGKRFVKCIEIDGGALMRAGILTYMWVQMGSPNCIFREGFRGLSEGDKDSEEKIEMAGK